MDNINKINDLKRLILKWLMRDQRAISRVQRQSMVNFNYQHSEMMANAEIPRCEMQWFTNSIAMRIARVAARMAMNQFHSNAHCKSGSKDGN
jgi:hypothetical protein